MLNPTCKTPNGGSSGKKLLETITASGFAAYDMLLYLDTHPDDREAMQYYLRQSRICKEAADQYARQYGPLCLNQIPGSGSSTWQWTMQPWPWEIRKGRC